MTEAAFFNNQHVSNPDSATTPRLNNVRLPLSIQLAKKYGGGQAFGNFCNAVLRKLPPDPRFDNEDRLVRRDQAKATAGEEEAQGVGGEANMRRLPLCEVRQDLSYVGCVHRTEAGLATVLPSFSS